MQKNHTVYVDADACPVKDEIEHLCNQYNTNVIFVSSFSHMSNEGTKRNVVLVDNHSEEVDFYITNHCKAGDIVVTQDYGLAALLLAKGVKAISHRGFQYREDHISELLFTRHLGSKQRRAGMKTKGPKKFTKYDIEKFCAEFAKILSNKEGY